MREPMIETKVRRILNQGISETQKKTVAQMLKKGKYTIEEISIEEVEQFAGIQTV